MVDSTQPTSSVVGSWKVSRRPTRTPSAMRAHASGVGGVIGVLAGLVWSLQPLVRAVRSESLAALPARSSSAASPLGSRDDGTATPVAAGHTPNEAIDSTGADSSSTDDRRVEEDGVALCAVGMRLVAGDYCTTVEHRCVEPFSDGSGRCNRFAEGSRCFPPVVAMRFCIDDFEYPNRRGEKPEVMVTYAEARAQCNKEHKRLCTAREWTLACEGPDRLPYPNGLIRDRGACNIDQPHRFPDVDALNNPSSVERELARLDQRTPSGKMAGCVSEFGVHDMIGNVDEWVTPDGPEEAAGFGKETALKGGYYGAVRSRCRPATPSHGPTFKFYQIGFRCCRDTAAEESTEDR